MEKKNGRGPTTRFERGAHGTERLGVFAVPSKGLLERQQQSRRDKESLIAALLEKKFEQTEYVDTPPELGNKELPIFGSKHEILETAEDHRAMIVISATGGGKSTQIPQFLMEAGYDHVYVLQQRRVMVDGLSDRIQSELDDALGEEKAANLVGAIHGQRVNRHKDNKITVLTAATFVRMLQDIEGEHADGKIGIFLDEIHEDDPYMELAVGTTGTAAHNHPNWRVFAASATVNPEPLKIPLGRITNFDNPQHVEVPVIRIEGRPHNMEMHEAPELNPAQAFLAHGEGHRVSILSTRGMEQLKSMQKTVETGLEEKAVGSSADVIFRKYSGKTSTYQRAEIARLAENLPEDKRLVVLATPAARSGITIPGTTFVATDGMINREVRDKFAARGLIAEYIAQAEIIQIMGRGGRDVDGGVGYLCRPMPRDTRPKRIEEFNKVYPFKPFDERDEYPLPAIFNSNLSELLLGAANAGVDLTRFNKLIVNEQDAKVLSNAINRLHKVFGALDEDGKITEIGKLMSKFPVTSEISRGLAEGMMKGRSRQHMARMSFIAAAVDAGGFQDFRVNRDVASWASLLSSGEDDDFIAQLDITLAVEEARRQHSNEGENYQFAYMNDLDYSRVYASRGPVEKMLRRLGMDALTMEVMPPSPTEITALREDFTAGMFDLVHREAGQQGKERVYAHVKDAKHEQLRSIASHSATVPAKGQLVGAMPVFYEKIIKGELEITHELAMTLKVDPTVVGYYAIQNGQVDYVPVSRSARINGGMVVDSEQAMFGTLNVGSHRSVKAKEFIPKESQGVLVEHLQRHPGPELLMLRGVAQELAEYRRIMPTDELIKYRRPGAPVDFTETEATRLLRFYAQRSRNAQDVDSALGDHGVEHNISVDLYYDAAAREEIIQRSPSKLRLGNTEVDIRYDNGKPYVTRLTKDQETFATQPIYLDDGREVLRQIKVEGVRGTRRVSFGYTTTD
ncbi:MAG: hypothetical protein ACOH18_04060 [Candidatus Saccharimonadaceae bacterium]